MPGQRRFGRRAVVAAACACVGLLAACGGEPRTYETPDLTFEYPDDWQRVEDVEFPNAEASGATTPEHTVGVDRENWVSVSADPLDAPLSDEEVAARLPEIAEDYRRALAGSGVRLVSRPATVRIRQATGVRARFAFSTYEGTPVTLTTTTLYRGAETWTIGCQSNSDHAESMAEGCRQVLDTLEIRR